MTELFYGRTKIRISPIFFAVISLFLIFDRSGIAFPVLCFSFFHECAHFLIMYLMKIPSKEIIIAVTGISVKLVSTENKAKKIAIFAAGFVLNYLFALFFLIIEKYDFLLINLAIAIFTSFPVPTSDGGEILKEITEGKKVGRYFAVSGILMICFLVLLTVVSKNYFCLVPIAYVAASFINRS